MTKNNIKQLLSSSHYRYYFVAAAVATAIAGIVHLYMPLSHPRMLGNIPTATFFLGSGIAQLFWVIPMIRRWGRIWYYIGIAGTVVLVILYQVTRVPKPLTGGRPAPTNEIGIAIMVFQIAYIAITIIILVRERRMKISQRQQLR